MQVALGSTCMCGNALFCLSDCIRGKYRFMHTYFQQIELYNLNKQCIMFKFAVN